MPPKKEAAAGSEGVIKGFTEKETRLLAAAFVATDGAGKIDYKIMADLSGHTEGTLKKFYPPIKRKVLELYPSFAGGDGGGAAKPAPAKPAPVKANGSKKRKIKISEDENSDGASDENGKTTKARPRGRPSKKGKKEQEEEKEAQVSEGDEVGAVKSEDEDI